MAVNAANAMLRQGKTALLICDLQEKFTKVICNFDNITNNSAKLINALKVLEVPMLVTEHYPKGLGKTVSQLDITGAKGPFAKTRFSMCIPEVNKELEKICSGNKPESIILIGIEAHICIENTAIDLRNNGYEVHTVADCCSSRTQEDRLLAFKRLQQIGCYICTSENVIYKLIGDAAHKDFKKILPFVKSPSNATGLVPNSKI